MAGWIARVRGGDLMAVPASFRWSTSVELAHLVDGYATVGGSGPLFSLMGRVMEDIEEGRALEVAALDMWLALFAQHRAARFDGYPPTKSERIRLNRLCQELRAAILRLDDAGRASIVNQFGCEGVPGGDVSRTATAATASA